MDYCNRLPASTLGLLKAFSTNACQITSLPFLKPSMISHHPKDEVKDSVHVQQAPAGSSHRCSLSPHHLLLAPSLDCFYYLTVLAALQQPPNPEPPYRLFPLLRTLIPIMIYPYALFPCFPNPARHMPCGQPESQRGGVHQLWTLCAQMCHPATSHSRGL